MKNSRGQRFTENTEVRLHKSTGEPLKERRRIASIMGFVADVPGGVILSEPLGHFRCWNIEDLELAGRHSARPNGR